MLTQRLTKTTTHKFPFLAGDVANHGQQEDGGVAPLEHRAHDRDHHGHLQWRVKDAANEFELGISLIL